MISASNKCFSRRLHDVECQKHPSSLPKGKEKKTWLVLASKENVVD